MAKLKINTGFSLNRLDLVVKGLVNTKFLGNYKSAFKGTGLEFADYRVYNSNNDDASRIDWKASKRVGQTLVKEFVEERNLEVIFLIDVSSQMLSGSTDKLKAEYIAEMVSTLSRSIISAGDNVGFILFSDQIVKEYPPQGGMKQYYVLTKSLIDTNNYKGYSKIDDVLNYAFKKFNDGSLVILVSDFIYGLKDEKILNLMCRKFDFISMMVRDPRDLSLPEGTGEAILEDPYSGSTLLVDPKTIGKEYAREASEQINKLKATMKKYGGEFLLLDTAKPFLKEIVRFFNIRAAKWK